MGLEIKGLGEFEKQLRMRVDIILYTYVNK